MKTVTLRGTGSVQTCTTRPGEKEWLVTCNEKGAEQIRLWERDPIMKSLLGGLNGIRHILIPRKLLLSTDPPQYIADAPAGTGPWSCSEGAWFCAGELEDLRTLHQQGMTVETLWQAVASLCDTLGKLLSLGIWGGADRGTVLLRSDGEICLTGITDFQAYQYPQIFPRKRYGEEDPQTTALRTLLGGLALCMDEPSRDRDENDSPLELQLGQNCTGALSALFRTASDLPPKRFLEEAKDLLLTMAGRIRRGSPRQMRLYLALLGGDCRQAEIPALSSVARCFCRCVEDLHETLSLPPVSTVLLYPWDGVELCELDPEIIPGVSALPSGAPRERLVPLGGLLDRLDRELERNIEDGGASLVCYIDLLTSKGNRSLNCMEQYLLEKLSRKRRLGIIDSILCGNDLQRPSRLLSRLVENSEADIVTTPAALERKMYQAVKNLLEAPYYGLEAPYLEENEDE